MGVTTLVISERENAEFSNAPSPNISPSPSVSDNYSYHAAVQERLLAFQEEGDDGHVRERAPVISMTSTSTTSLISTTPFTPRALGFAPLLRISEYPSISGAGSVSYSALMSSSSPHNESILSGLQPSNLPSPSDIYNASSVVHSNASFEVGPTGPASIAIQRATVQRYRPLLILLRPLQHYNTTIHPSTHSYTHLRTHPFAVSSTHSPTHP